MSELKAALEDDSTPSNQDTVSEEDDNLSDLESHTGSERDAASEAGSETPSLSDRSSQRASRSASNTPTNTRSTRSRDNPDFVAKQKSFMAKVQAATAGSEGAMVRPETPGKRRRDGSAFTSSTKKRKLGKTDNNGQDYQNDNYCWECHREGVFICCEMCPRVFHLKCAGMEKEPEEDWACSECHAVMQAENTENRSRSMQLISVEQLCTLLKYALNRLKTMAGMEPFTKPVDTTEFPTYEDIVVHPVDFTSLERNIKRKFYGSTEAFSADARWIVHNSVIFNGANSKVSSMARSLVKILKQEMSEIETCPDCYMNAHQNPKSWFTEVCRSAHPLIWARLKGFPFWPAKAVKWKDGNVDVRFFGRHDRSWVPIKECFLFSEQMPTPLKNRNKTLEACLQEVNEHIAKLREKFGKFKYAPHRIQFNPLDPDQIKIMLPNYKGPVPQRVRPQSRALSRLSAHSDDETSSIASTDSAGGMRRGRKESGTSSATQGTETETEVPTHMPEALQHRKSGSKSPSQESEEVRRRESNQEREKSKEVPYSEDENLTLSAVSLRPTEKAEEQEDEEMEDCGKYPGQKSSPDNSDMEEDEEEEGEECHQEEDESSSLVNGKSHAVKNEPGSEEEAEEGAGGEGKGEGGGGGGGSSSDGEDEEMAAPASDKDGNEDETEETMKKDIKEEGEEEDDDNDDNKEEEEEEEEEDEDEEEEDEEEEQEEEEESRDKKELNEDSQTEVAVKVENNVRLEESVIQKTVIAKKTEDSCIGGENGMRSERIPSRENTNKTVEMNEVRDERKVEEKINDTLEKATCERQEVKDKRRISLDKDEETVTNNSKVNPTNEDDRKERTSENKVIEMEERIKSEVEGQDSDDDDDDDNDDDDNDNDEEMNEEPLKEKTVIPEGDEEKNESTSEGESVSESKRKEKSNEKQETKECDGDTREQEKEATEKTGVDRESEEESRIQTMDKEMEERSERSERRMDTSESSGNASGSDQMEIDIKKEMEVTREEEEEEEEEQVEQEPQRQEEEAEMPEEQVIKEEMDTSEDFERRESVIREKEREDAEETARNSLMDAVQLMKTMGTIAITRLDGKSLGDRTNGDSITLSRKETHRAEESSEEDKRSTGEDAMKNCSKNVSPPTTKEVENKNMEQHISSLGCSVSVTKAVERDKDKDKVREKEREKEKVKMPSGVDTTRLSPSISIIPMSGGSERQKAKTTTAPSSPDATTAASSTTSSHRNTSPSVGHNLPHSSPSSHSQQAAPTRVSSSSSNSPQASTANLPPPPPLSHPQAPPSSSVGSRGVFGPPPPGSINMAGGRGPIMTTPGIRMVGGVGGPGMMVPARMPGGPPPRHLPPEAGPLSAQLHKHSQKLAEVMRATLEDILGGLVMTGTPEARVAALQLELERTNWRHQQEVAEVRHNADVMLVEMRANLEAEKQRAVDEVKRQMEAQMMEARRQMEVQMMERLAEVRRQMEAEKQRAVEETKRKQWCANCGKEALFFCCWNTSYCDYPCQQSHWPQHMSVCGQNSDGGGGGEGGPDSINGEASAHSSRVSTPVQNLVTAQQYVEDDGGVAALAEEHRRRKMREDDAGSLTSSILAQCLIKGNRDRSKKKAKSPSSVKSSPPKDKDKDKDKESLSVPPKAPKSPKAWMEWFLEQSGAEGIKENLQVTPKTGKAKARKSSSKQAPDGPRKKRKSTPCVRRKIEHILKPEEVTTDMLDRVATKPKEKTHDQENGTSCHQCRQKTSDTKTICRSGKCVGLRGFFCGPCLRTRYGEDARKALLDPDWCCPVCRGICNCSLCRKAFGQQAVGQIVQRLGKMGYTSVQQYLDSKGIKEEQADPGDKADKELRPEEEEEEEEEESQEFGVAKVERLELPEEEDCAMDT